MRVERVSWAAGKSRMGSSFRGTTSRMSNSNTSGVIPRGCYAVDRGNLAADPKTIDCERPFVSARMGVNMAAPEVGAEEHEKLTERVNIIAFAETLREKLLKCSHGT